MRWNPIDVRCCCIVLLLAAGLLSGCSGGAKAPPSDIQTANTLLVDALEAWKSGKSAADLKAADPKIYFAEDLLAGGARLKSYTIQTPGEMYGTNVRFSVSLECEGADQKKTSQVQYLVCTTPAQCISRQE